MSAWPLAGANDDVANRRHTENDRHHHGNGNEGNQ